MSADLWKDLRAIETSELRGRSSAWTGGGRVLFIGDVDLTAAGVGQAEILRGDEADHGAVEQTSLYLLLEPSSAVSPQQLRSVEFWEDRLVQTAVRYEKLAEENDRRPEDQRVSLASGIAGLSTLAVVRTAGMDARLAALQQNGSARVATSAGLLLAQWKLPVERGRYIPLLAGDDRKTASQAAAVLTLSGGMEGIDYLVEQASREGPAGRAYATLGRYADEPLLTANQRRQGAVKIIAALVPKEETPSALFAALLARRWTGQDYGYHIGTPEANRRALERYHEWADQPDAAAPATAPAAQ